MGFISFIIIFDALIKYKLYLLSSSLWDFLVIAFMKFFSNKSILILLYDIFDLK